MCGNLKPKIVQHGFTMLELMVVLAIIAIAAAIVVPIASSAGSMQLRAAVTMVAADLEYAKSMSISRGQRYSVVFDSTNEEYRIADPNGTTIAHPVNVGHPYAVNFRNDSRLSGVDIVSAGFDGVSTVAFDYLGIPYSVPGVGSPTALLSAGVIRLRAGGIERTVSVEPVTGYITISTN
jgi:prepilin-type N-terminal cleavage/methylation domain-containing protein